MKQLLVLYSLFTFIQITHAQKQNTDSLWRIFETTNNDSIRLKALNSLHYAYISIAIDSNFYYSKRLLKTCEKINTPRYTALGMLLSSYVYIRIGDYQKVQEQIVKAATIAEKYDDEEVLSLVERYRNSIETNPYKKIEHLQKALHYKKRLSNIIILGNLSSTFLYINQIDSAFFLCSENVRRIC
jgi:hypothetical protein